MEAARAVWPDWRDAAAYAPLLEADRSLFAWEWLRRDPAYRNAAGRASSKAGRAPGAAGFGLVDFEEPQLAVPHARPLWRSTVHPFVLTVEPGRADAAADMLELDRLGAITRVIATDDSDHLLLSDGLRSIRLDGPKRIFSDGPVSLRYVIGGVASAGPPLLTLRRLLDLCRTGHFSRSLHRREGRSGRWIMILRAQDALVAGASQRQVAEELFSRSAGAPRWRIRDPSVRSQAQRLVRLARRFAAGGYRSLLR